MKKTARLLSASTSLLIFFTAFLFITQNAACAAVNVVYHQPATIIHTPVVKTVYPHYFYSVDSFGRIAYHGPRTRVVHPIYRVPRYYPYGTMYRVGGGTFGINVSYTLNRGHNVVRVRY